MASEQVHLPDWIYRQSAVLPYRQGPDGLEVLLVTSRKGSHWVLPKGIVEPGLTAPQSAAKEAWEEAGVEGQVGAESLGSYRYRKWGGTCKVEVFPMEVRAEKDNWPEREFRRRAWLTLSEASKRVNKKRLGKIVRCLPDAIDATQAAEPGTAAPSQRCSAAANRPGRMIYLLRHAKSGRADPNLRDFERPLSPRGERALEKMRRYLDFIEMKPDLVLCSSATRARQTLMGILPAIGEDVSATFDPRIYRLGERGLLNRLRQLSDDLASVMVVGHNPGIHALALRLVGGGDTKDCGEIRESFPAGALATLIWRGRHWSEIGPATCELQSLVVPGHL